jgi:hypothetical protein
LVGVCKYQAHLGAANRGADPLDDRVVEAYWLGNPLLERVPGRLLATHLDGRFAKRAGRGWNDLATLAVCGGRAHHNFHVFAVYPWVGMLRAGFEEQPLRVLNLCRIRWGTVLAVHNGGGDAATAEVLSSSLEWDGARLRLGQARAQTATLSAVQANEIGPGNTVSLHWDWVCEVLTSQQVRWLRHYTATQLRLANALKNATPLPLASAKTVAAQPDTIETSQGPAAKRALDDGDVSRRACVRVAAGAPE